MLECVIKTKKVHCGRLEEVLIAVGPWISGHWRWAGGRIVQ